MGRVLFALIVGIGGVAVLASLGIWQMQRLSWKEALVAEIDNRIAAAPVALPDSPDPVRDRYLPVRVTGHFVEGQAKMLASAKHVGAVHRIIVPFDTGTRRVLVDTGWVRAGKAVPALPEGDVALTGNLDWPREADGFTAPPDLAAGLWFARDVPALAAHLDTAPVMLVLRDPVPGITAWPVNTAGIPNDHLQYAITWFSLATLWAGMTAFYIFRARPKGSA